MAEKNGTKVTEFTLLGLSHTPELQIIFFVVFLSLYLLTMAGNLLIMVTIYLDPRLHSPMYFFLSNLSFLDLCYSTVTVPRSLVDFLSHNKTISFNDCIAQLFFLHLFAGTECFLLTLMAYDRYVAICNPLRYIMVMNKSKCIQLVASTWVASFVHSITQALLTFQLPFCGPNEINHFFCDVHPLSVLACSSIFIIEAVMVANSGLIAVSCFVVLLASYTGILSTVLRIRSADGRRKAFSTCASHLTVVTLFFGPSVFMYMRPSVTFLADKVVSVFYTVITPLLNPIIYSLRNEDMKTAIKKLKGRTVTSQGA
ncbi:olfactory receptor 1509-like [Rhinatrema bivittatum]|uniref:olfactory receptor 1509-like n=1 Tax=Rhinatrema bivittatum TaxID=194408 RepID=UPI00112C245E|nr:olfactory receptor 1509-like [Rhinatrema bivittatum]